MPVAISASSRVSSPFRLHRFTFVLMYHKKLRNDADARGLARGYRIAVAVTRIPPAYSNLGLPARVPCIESCKGSAPSSMFPPSREQRIGPASETRLPRSCEEPFEHMGRIQRQDRHTDERRYTFHSCWAPAFAGVTSSLYRYSLTLNCYPAKAIHAAGLSGVYTAPVDPQPASTGMSDTGQEPSHFGDAP